MKGNSLLKGAIVVIIAVFAIHQVVSALYKPIKTETAVYYTAIDGLNITGVVLRNEHLVKYNGNGVMHFTVSDGNHVSKDGVIVNFYDNETSSVNLSKINELNAKIKELQELMSYNYLEAADLNMINTKVNDSVNSFVLSGAAGNYQNLPFYAENLLASVNKRQAALGVKTDFTAQINELKAQVDSLSAGLTAPIGSVTAEKSGYFVSKTDGYENVLNCTQLDKVTPDFIDSVKPEEYDKTVVGKIVSDYEWYIAAEMSVDNSLKYKEGDEAYIYTSVKTFPKLSVKVKKINISDDSSAAVVIFESNDMNSELATIRTGPMTVVKNEYSGLRVPKKALRSINTKDGIKRGVYTLTGMQVRFVPIDIVYSNDVYMICKQETSTETVLRLYDEVIVKGKKLYDGKIIN